MARKRKLVKINADGVRSRYGFIMEEYKEEFALIKVANSCDWMNWLIYKHCIILGKDLYESLNA